MSRTDWQQQVDLLTFTFDFLTSKLIRQLHVTRTTFTPILYFLKLIIVLVRTDTGQEDGQTDGRTDGQTRCKCVIQPSRSRTA